MKPSCPFCQKKNLRLVFHPQDRKIYQCLGCSLVSAASDIVNRQGSPKITIQGGNSLYQKRGEQWCQEYLAETPYYLSRFRKRLLEIEKRKKPGRILDVGCATGLFLELAQSCGWQPFGIDLAKEAIDHCQKRFPPSHLFRGPLEKAGFKNQFFDIVTVFDTLEHLPDLDSFINQARRVLKEDGLLGITVPNQACFLSRLMGKFWFDYQKRQHLYFFTPETLKMVLKRTCFKIILAKKEPFLTASAQTSLSKLRRYYSHHLVNQGLFWGKRLFKFLKIKTIVLPLEHIYVLAKKI